LTLKSLQDAGLTEQPIADYGSAIVPAAEGTAFSFLTEAVVRYSPILKGKEGELSALSELDIDHWHNFRPIIEALPSEKGTTAAKRIPRLVGQLQETFGSAKSFALDLTRFPNDELPDGSNEWSEIFALLQQANIAVVPCRRPDLMSPAAAATIANAVQQFSSGLVIRLGHYDWHSSSELLANCREIAEECGCTLKQIDLLFDVGSIEPNTMPSLRRSLIDTLSRRSLQQFRSITCVSAAYPTSLSGVPAYSRHTIPRLDWQLFLDLHREVDQPVNFGDYAAVNPELVKVTPSDRIPPKVVYTTDSEWVVFKGKPPRTDGYEQYFKLAKQVREDSAYRYRQFSFGDELIDDCAKQEWGPGSASDWVAVKTSHHVVTALEQLAKLSAA
jgi:hypothetical protein